MVMESREAGNGPHRLCVSLEVVERVTLRGGRGSLRSPRSRAAGRRTTTPRAPQARREGRTCLVVIAVRHRLVERDDHLGIGCNGGEGRIAGPFGGALGGAGQGGQRGQGKGRETARDEGLEHRGS